MKNAPERADDGKSPYERFTELGERLMRVPREDVAALGKKWRVKRKRRPKRKV